ncbi:lipopolysaccharide assembly protein LapA domain-containing protein [Kiritimatiella glycovorans]|uniref:Uncharacterized protein n=1 Tax=Kiritimatiella glycovorans TaxID=1307763 RepID=A0A0G3EIN2_9BACT|nr:lipopolysaccharide assembly protein LapA domain-containing protein [Kiritimatiella glycovorans]AKJ64004.1 hypothetical protein L21SP4_00736 [Kiritimatiella glycovorans]
MRMIWALVLIGVCVLLYIFNRGHIDLNLLLFTVKKAQLALVLLGFTAAGVVIGFLLR